MKRRAVALETVKGHRYGLSSLWDLPVFMEDILSAFPLLLTDCSGEVKRRDQVPALEEITNSDADIRILDGFCFEALFATRSLKAHIRAQCIR